MPKLYQASQSGNSYVFVPPAVGQGNDYFFARKRDIFWGGVFFARKREKKKLGVFFVFFGVFLLFGGCFCSLWVFFFVFRALARNFFGFVFRGGPKKSGNSRSEASGTSGDLTRDPSVLFAEVVTQMGIEPMTTRCLLVALTTTLVGQISLKPARTVAELASARQHQESPAGHHVARGGG